MVDSLHFDLYVTSYWPKALNIWCVQCQIQRSTNITKLPWAAYICNLSSGTTWYPLYDLLILLLLNFYQNFASPCCSWHYSPLQAWLQSLQELLPSHARMQTKFSTSPTPTRIHQAVDLARTLTVMWTVSDSHQKWNLEISRYHIELTVHVVTITDVATDTTTQCYGQRGPCAYSTPEPPPEKPLDKDHPAECDDPSFSFYVTSWQYVSNYSIVVSHTVDDGVHTGPSGPLDYETYRDSFHESCAASGFCDAVIINATNPIVIPFAWVFRMLVPGRWESTVIMQQCHGTLGAIACGWNEKGKEKKVLG